MSPVLFVGIVGVLVLAVAVYVLWPLLKPSGDAELRDEASEDAARIDQREAALAALRDIEFEYRLGNLTEADYRQLRERYYRRALATLRGRSPSDALDEELEREIATLRQRAAARCATCGGPLLGGRCPRCGITQPLPS